MNLRALSLAIKTWWDWNLYWLSFDVRLGNVCDCNSRILKAKETVDLLISFTGQGPIKSQINDGDQNNT